MSDDPFNLRRFVEAQDDAAIYSRALGELRNGRKQSHWIWFVFPQIAGLGSSPMSHAYAIRSLGGIDATKVRSSMTLFATADPSEPLFREVLARFYAGEEDPATIRLLG
ncbi:MAG TPA: DUF1810 family protein [Solirubrobacterales bacterium]